MMEEPESNTSIYNWFVMLGDPYGEKWYFPHAVGWAEGNTFHEFTYSGDFLGNTLGLPDWTGHMPVFNFALSITEKCAPSQPGLVEPNRMWVVTNPNTDQYKLGAILWVDLVKKAGEPDAGKRVRVVWNNRPTLASVNYSPTGFPSSYLVYDVLGNTVDKATSYAMTGKNRVLWFVEVVPS